MSATNSELVGTIRTKTFSAKYSNNKYLPAKIKHLKTDVSDNYGCPGSIQQLTDVKANLILSAKHVSQEWKRLKDGDRVEIECVVTFEIVEVLGPWM